MFAGRCSASGSGAVLKTPAASCIVASSVRLSQDLERKLCQQDWCESATCCMLEIDGFQSVGTLSSVASFRRAGAPKTLARLRVPATQRVRSRFLMESSLRGSLGSSGSGSSVADSVLKQLASLEQSLSSNLAGLRQIQATVAAMEGTGKPETQSQSLQSQRAAATPATAVCEGTQDQRSTLLETKWQLGRQVKWFEASALHSSMC